MPPEQEPDHRGGREDHHQHPENTSAVPDEQTREAVATLFRVLRPEPRLRLGQTEAEQLAPLVVQWLERGSTPADLTNALLPGLPDTVHSAVAVLRSRLERKMPPVQAAVRPAAARLAECAKCPTARCPQPGICRPCAGLPARTVAVGGGADVAAAGAAGVRTAIRSTLACGQPARATA
ncbi:hypothetical protein ACFY00_05480 [Kitasatospora sp. NPDC001540]|uniref:hypothetical protein n=1 Tax=Kitasatospora sp. NPDC001540 TaxID=3364014 RepID=UPI0036BABC48